MTEQAKSSQEISTAANDVNQQTRETSTALKEQAESFKQITDNSASITKQIKLIAATNLDNSRSTAAVLERIQQVRDVSQRNGVSAQGIKRILAEAPESAKRKNGGHNSGIAG